ncbi:MAG: hypothetical protein IJI44_04520 [Erysipelotrichaceae bacterium]|nr:hypothetical protein [Erysipelotrichaceae bacterium]
MLCPYCGSEMIEGFVQSREQLYFNRGKKARFIASGDLGSISLSRFNLIKAPAVKAALCRKCRKIIIDLAEK